MWSRAETYVIAQAVRPHACFKVGYGALVSLCVNCKLVKSCEKTLYGNKVETVGAQFFLID